MNTATSSNAHTGTFIATDAVVGSIYGINDDGTGFSDQSSLILPFRTYMKKTASAANQQTPYVSVIYIDQANGIEHIYPDGSEREGEEGVDGDYLIVSPAGKNCIRIESTYSTTVSVYTVSGQLYRILDVRPGNATYSGFQSGLYVVGTTKIRVM